MPKQPKYAKRQGLFLTHGNWWVRMVVPADCRKAFGKANLMENLGTGDLMLARQLAEPVRRRFKALIADARSGGTPEALKRKLNDWKAEQATVRPTGTQQGKALASAFGFGSFPAPPDRLSPEEALIIQRAGLIMERLRAVDHPAIEQIAPTVGRTVQVDGLLAQAGVPDTLNNRAAAAETAGQVAGVQFLQAVADSATLKAQGARLAVFGDVAAPKPVILSGVSLERFFDTWLFQNPRPAKEEAKNRQFLRRLGEFMGDGLATDLGKVTKADALEFFALLKRFPARRKGALNALPFREIVETNDRVEGTEAYAKPLSPETLGEWLNFYKSYFREAVDNDKIGVNPFAHIKHRVDRTDLKGEAYTPEEIEKLFGSALFTGHAGDTHRLIKGDQIIKDALYWLPLVALFSGARASEWAASPLDAVREEDGIWILDLSKRALRHDAGARVKNKNSRREVPIHKELIRLGFIDYVKELRQQGAAHLFPDLNHESPHGPFHKVSKWFGERRRLMGMERSFHDLRHTWKRAAVLADIPERKHDILSGHASQNIGGKYGHGLPRDVAQEEMDKISYPSLPL